VGGAGVPDAQEDTEMIDKIVLSQVAKAVEWLFRRKMQPEPAKELTQYVMDYITHLLEKGSV
jgi:hypothetical protein